jgi:hypothetical protein
MHEAWDTVGATMGLGVGSAALWLRGCVPAKFAELMLEVLLGLQRNMTAAPFSLEFGDELSGFAQLPMVEKFGASNRPNLDSLLQFLGGSERDLLACFNP